ncbi:class I SAM-dependent methyltransferase [Mucilaginibacter arboris]|uniref:Methyltransferase domain-containing protein n=1 Tax=Mucilaginibacter arboris TaxID=2682090 RepID=A0A7K1SRS1_9SPHI|nr:class I SAM-dependent methyltransferase [Mucilaginibacter arboris]MVN20003.1 methyltransferase domain-containing protein [Mucilaginibacter arboris]
MSNQLTDRTFWKKYWESKKDLAVAIKPDYTFHKLLKKLVKKNNIRTAIELGGFPGYYAIYLNKYEGIETTLFDYYVHTGILVDVLAANDLSEKSIGVIEGDLFKYKALKQYDLVLSCGLIEHFEDTKDIIQRHLPFLKPGGTLFITLPNFLGINGWVQRNFDPENYSKHNVKSMELDLLAYVCHQLNLKDVELNHYGKFSVWLENGQTKSVAAKILTKTIWLAGKLFTRIVPVESKLLSPYIVLTARKPQ